MATSNDMPRSPTTQVKNVLKSPKSPAATSPKARVRNLTKIEGDKSKKLMLMLNSQVAQAYLSPKNMSMTATQKYNRIQRLKQVQMEKSSILKPKGENAKLTNIIIENPDYEDIAQK